MAEKTNPELPSHSPWARLPQGLRSPSALEPVLGCGRQTAMEGLALNTASALQIIFTSKGTNN